ncbi:MAG: trehalose-6-phosphate synthase [Chloroflexi bacterium]|nr:MAG: trehalose-6-phosphate synthase [Chloroflexota bacterium]
MTDGAIKRLVVVSNRLPVVVERGADGAWDVRQGAGGLVTALAPVLRDRGGLWIGWPGSRDEDIDAATLASVSGQVGYRLVPVSLPSEIVSDYYDGFANATIWPLFHDLPSRSIFRPSYWRAYTAANEHFATAIAAATTEDDWVWVHDYHLMLVPQRLQAAGAPRRCGFFLHIPFPPVDIYLRLPWRFQVLHGLLSHDLIGLQTARDARNFVACVRALVKGVKVTRVGESYSLELGPRRVQVGAFPISIDFNRFATRAAAADVTLEVARLREVLPDNQLILGVDRLDYSKGIPERLLALQDALRRYPELQGNVALYQVVVPSREHVPEYQLLKSEIERLVGEINGEFTQPGWQPVHYVYRSLSMRDLLAFYRMADICLVTSLKDGMNLVSKEYCACSIDEDGVLILSEFAGSAGQLRRGALLVNPHDIEGCADAIHAAFRMPRSQRRQRMRQMRRSIERSDVFWWTESYLAAAIHKRLDAFPTHEYFVPDAPSGRFDWADAYPE